MSQLLQWKKARLRLFKESDVHVKSSTILETDTRYIGIMSIHENSLLPKKHSKNCPFTKDDKKNNHKISKDRIFVEHAIRMVKRFRILSDCYRNRRKRFNLRFSLIAGICNFELSI